jgi:hypothetical protein
LAAHGQADLYFMSLLKIVTDDRDLRLCQSESLHRFALVWQPVPPWVPGRTVLAYGLGILFRVSPRVAAWCETAMVSLFTLLVWLPFVVAKLTDRGSWTGFFISWTIGSSAWIVAEHHHHARCPRHRSVLRLRRQ